MTKSNLAGRALTFRWIMTARYEYWHGYLFISLLLCRIRRSLGSSRESLGASRESLPDSGVNQRRRDAFADVRGREASAERIASDNAALNEANRRDKKAVFRLDLPNQSKSLEIKAR